jgi:tripartite-type tricarboxylate transporter receptor subunit TctC
MIACRRALWMGLEIAKNNIGERSFVSARAPSLSAGAMCDYHAAGGPFMKRFVLAAATFALCAPAPAQSDYPNKPVKIIVDSAPGSATDVINRLVGDRLAQTWGQQVLTLNHPGAGGSMAVRAASQAEADGATFFVGNASVFLALKGEPGVAPNLPVELPRDFIPIGFIAQQPMFIAVAPQTGIKSLPELIEAAKQRPGTLSYATTGRGRITHLTMELLQSRAGIVLQMIPYSGGPTAAMADVTTGRVAIIVEAYSGLAGGLQSGSIKGIAVTSHERLAEFKDLATVAEALPGFIAGGWNVLLAPIGTPAAIVDKVSIDLAKVLGETEVKTTLATLGAHVRPMKPAEVMAFVEEQQRTWRPVAEKVAKDMAHPAK